MSGSRQRSEREERYFEDAHPASDPVHPVRLASVRSSTPVVPRERAEIRTDPIGPDSDDVYHRRVSFGRSARPAELDDDEEYDRTLDAVAENLRVQRERQQRRPHLPAVETDSMDEHEISQLADARAARASARVHARHTHDTLACTVCSARTRSHQRKASRRARLLQAEQRRDAIELEESLLLDALNNCSSPTTHAGVRLGDEQLATLRLVLQEHWDEFLHQRMLYAELADELKGLSPSMSQTKRRILAQHVLEAVEALELKADRINRLEQLLEVGQGEKREHGPASPRGKVRKEPGSRHASTGAASTASAASQNRLKHALESLERSSKHTSTASPRLTTATRSNSPPTTLRL